MRLLPRFRSWFKRTLSKRDYEAAQFNRLTADLPASNLTADAANWNSLATMRSRARTLERDNPLARKYLSIVVTKIVGCGISLQNKAKLHDGKLDKPANSIVETGWYKWGKRKYCTVDGQLSWNRLKRLAARTVARDGEMLIRIVRGFPNAFGFALQPVEADHLDETLNERLANGREIRMGVELDVWKRPVAYYLLARHPGDSISMFGGAPTRMKHERVEAKDMIYLGLPDRAGQTRCVTWMSAAVLPIHHLSQYEKAEVIAARQQANNQGYFEKTVPENLTDARTKNGDAVALPDGFDSGELVQESSPGQMTELPMGVKAILPPPTHPNSVFAPAKSAFLRTVASGLCVSAADLGSDYSQANYSSMRASALEANPGWKILQQWIIEDLCEQVFEAWLEMALLSGQLPGLFLSDYDRLNQPEFRAAAFPYVDPQKDAMAQILLRDNKLKSHRQIVAEQGGDIEDLFDEIEADDALAAEKGITIPSSSSPATTVPQPSPEMDNEDDEEEDDQDEEDKKPVRAAAPAPVPIAITVRTESTTPKTVKKVTFKRADDGTVTGADVEEVEEIQPLKRTFDFKADRAGRMTSVAVVETPSLNNPVDARNGHATHA